MAKIIVNIFMLVGLCSCIMVITYINNLHGNITTFHSNVIRTEDFPDTTLVPFQLQYNSTLSYMFSTTEPPFYENIEPHPQSQRMNVLFIMTDDMRAQLGVYQTPDAPLNTPLLITPHLDKLAAKSLLLRRAYVQFSLCGPSRTAILTGRRPDTTRIFDNRNYWREWGGNYTSLPQYFKDNGYTTVGIGKIFHKDVSSNDNDPISWSMPYIMPTFYEGKYLDNEAGWRPVTKREQVKYPLMDTLAVESAKEVMTKLAPEARTGEKPFFLALGFKKPHASYVCPKEFFDLYPSETEEQFLSDISWQTITFKRERKRNLQNVTITDGEIILPHEALRDMRRAYFACVSYVDSLVGKVMDILEELDLAKSTIVSFISDHGYHFGENALYGKQSLWETGTHVPMMIHIPGRTDDGVDSKSIVESIDLFPTLAEAAGLPRVPTCPNISKHIELCTEGTSFMPLVDYPKKIIKRAALSQIAVTLSYMRYTMRTARFRYTEWTRCHRDITADGTYKILVMNPRGYSPELYDHKHDPHESLNLASSPHYLKIKQRLSIKLQSLISNA